MFLHHFRDYRRNPRRRQEADLSPHEHRRESHQEVVAPLTEIAENDCNLNIPRYVDTFEEEAPIDLAEVTAEIKQLDAGTAEIDDKIAAYCQELGIDSPFEVKV